jgi:hypothetical protein
MHIVILSSIIALGGCASGGSTHVSRSSDTQTVRDVNGATQYRIRDGSVFNTSGARVARIDSSGNILNSNGARVGTISKR